MTDPTLPFGVGDMLVCTDSREDPPRVVEVVWIVGDKVKVENTRTGRRTRLTWPKLTREWRVAEPGEKL